MSQQINLYNPLFLKQKKHFSARTMVPSLAVIVVGVLLAYGYALVQRDRMAKLSAGLEQQFAKQRNQLAALVTQVGQTGRSQLLEQEIVRTTSRLREGRQLLSALRSGDLGNSKGFSRYLTAFARRTVPGVWITGFTLGEGENALVLRGRVVRSELMPVYIRSLSNEEVMRGRKVVEMKISAHNVPLAAPTLRAAASGEGAGAAAARTPLEFLEFSVVAPKVISGPATSSPESGKGAS